MRLPVIFGLIVVCCISSVLSDHSKKYASSDTAVDEAKRIERKGRGDTKYHLQQPTVKNKKFRVTTSVPVVAGREGPPPAKSVPRRPVKKAAQQSSVNDEIQRFPSLASLIYIDEPVPSTTSTTTAKPTTTRRTTTTPRPTKRTTTYKPRTKDQEKNTKKTVSDFACPQPEKIPFQWFPLPCDSHKQCKRSMGKNYRCCEINSNSFKTCTKGVLKAVPEQKHSPVFGVPVKCPKVPLAELFWNVQTCDTDSDCWPRVCCPDGRKKFCRSPNPEFKEAKNPIARQLMQPYKSATSFIQCTIPSPFDLHPQPCNSTLDCFPNLCCQEGAKRHCRPPQRSLFSRVANTVSQTLFGN